ncbi:MAG: TRAP transporter small permease subunit [Cucumibacter sp.]
MREALTGAAAWLARRAENIAALMLATLFLSFILQIVFRYALGLPTGWSHELSVSAWLWLILFGSAFVVREQETIRLDLIYSASPASLRRAMALICAIAMVVLFTVSLPAILDYVLFMKVQRTAYLKIRFDWLFSIYIVFAVAMIVRHLWLGAQAIWGAEPPRYDGLAGSSGA